MTTLQNSGRPSSAVPDSFRCSTIELLDGDPRGRARWLAACTGRDETALGSGVVERVSTGLMAVRVGLRTSVARYLTLPTGSLTASGRPRAGDDPASGGLGVAAVQRSLWRTAR
jgi:hypothetical protein